MYAVLRPTFFAVQGLLQMLALPIKAGSDTGGAALPALGALLDVLEHVLAQQRGERGAEDQEAGGVHAAGTRWAAAPRLGPVVVMLLPLCLQFLLYSAQHRRVHVPV